MDIVVYCLHAINGNFVAALTVGVVAEVLPRVDERQEVEGVEANSPLFGFEITGMRPLMKVNIHIKRRFYNLRDHFLGVAFGVGSFARRVSESLRPDRVWFGE